MKFKNIHHQVFVPIAISADFESFTKPINKVCGATKLYQQHVSSAFCIYVISRVEGFSMDPITYVCQSEDDEVDKMFVEKLEEVTRKIYENFKDPRPMIFDEAAKRLHNAHNRCCACGNEFNEKDFNMTKVCDHCHFTDAYRGALHSKCNLKLRRSKTIPVIFHNLSGYDSHLFVKRLADTPGDVTCIPHNEEKYMTISKRVLVNEEDDDVEEGVKKREFWNLKFIDSLNFMKGSLENLAGNLDRNRLKHMSKYFQGEKMELMCGKETYPYDYMTDVSKFRERNLPPREAFATHLNAGTMSVGDTIEPIQISEEKYQLTQRVFRIFYCKNLADFTEVYCKQDVLLLADVIENFVDVCFEKYGLDPLHYISAPSLSMSAMLKMTGVELELLRDRDMHIFFENGIRGGVSVITGRYAKANNPYMTSKCLRGESLMTITKQPWTVHKEYSEKTAGEITKYFRKRLGGNFE